MHNLTMNGFGIPSFGGYLLGDGDTMIVLKVVAKQKRELTSFLNVTIIGGYRNI